MAQEVTVNPWRTICLRGDRRLEQSGIWVGSFALTFLLDTLRTLSLLTTPLVVSTVSTRYSRWTCSVDTASCQLSSPSSSSQQTISWRLTSRSAAPTQTPFSRLRFQSSFSCAKSRKWSSTSLNLNTSRTLSLRSKSSICQQTPRPRTNSSF